MSTDVFTIPRLRFEVARNADGSISWSDTYGGQKVRTALPLEGGSRCVILLDTDASKQAVFRNLFCVGQDGDTIWTADLPETHDAFVSVEMGADGLHANSWSGFRVTLDLVNGRAIGWEFTK